MIVVEVRLGKADSITVMVMQMVVEGRSVGR